jgi:predicted DNA-binding transcriptional regulator AlpA
MKRPKILVDENPPARREFLTEEQLAAEWGVRPQTLAAMRCRGGGPPYVKVGRLVRYRRDAVERWEASRTGSSTSQLSAAGV